MNFESMKNIVTNICEIWSSDDDREEDLLDNLRLYGEIGKITGKEAAKIDYYLEKYMTSRGK